MKKHAIAAAITLVLIASGCTNITPKDIENAKAAFLANDPEKCGQIGDQMTQDICVMTIAQNTKNPALCERLQLNQSKDSCFVGFAFSNTDPTFCEKLSSPSDQEDCRKDVSELQAEVLKAAVVET